MRLKCIALFFLPAVFCIAQVEVDLNKRIDSIVSHCLKTEQLNSGQAAIFSKLIKDRPVYLRKLIDSAWYDFVVIQEDYNIKSKIFERSATFIAKGYEELYYKNGKIIRPLADYKGIKDSLSKLILHWPFKTIEPLDPPPIVFSESYSTPSEKTKRKMKKAEDKEKKKGGTDGSIYRVVTVINLVNGKRNIALFIPRRKIREVIFITTGK